MEYVSNNDTTYRRAPYDSLCILNYDYCYRKPNNTWRFASRGKVNPTIFNALEEAQNALDEELIKQGYVIMTRERLNKLEILL